MNSGMLKYIHIKSLRGIHHKGPSFFFFLFYHSTDNSGQHLNYAKGSQSYRHMETGIPRSLGQLEATFIPKWRYSK